MSEKKLDELRSHNLEFKESILAESKAEGDALRQQITLKNQDLTRLRGQRDEMNAELLERRSREAEKMRFVEEVEVLAKAREDRIGYLIGEVKLLRSSAAARDGSTGYLAWLKREEGVDGDYIKDLEAKYRSVSNMGEDQPVLTSSDTQIRLEAYIAEQQNAKAANGDVKGGSAACDVGSVKADLEVTKAALDKYERVFGPNPSVAEDVKQLAQKLRVAEDERERLKLELSTAEDVSDPAQRQDPY
jgi:E3 ubiquitin-protein ligase BRE1